MPDLFSSTTANSSYSLFFGPREMALFNDYNVELSEIVARQNLIYWSIESEMSEQDRLYGESEKKIARNPIQIYGRIMLDEPVTESGKFTTEIRRRIEVYLHKDRLTEVGLVPRIGDFLEWDNQFFEIISAVVPQFVHGFPEAKIGVNLSAISARVGTFNPRMLDTEHDIIEHDAQNPY